MHLATLALTSLLFGQIPSGIPMPSAAQRGPTPALRPIAEPEPTAAAEGAVGESDPDPAASEAGEPVKIEPAGPAKTEAEAPVTTEPEDTTETGSDAAAAETPLRPVLPARYRPTPPEMVAEALVLPAASRLTGQPLTLLTALSSTFDRRQQLAVTQAYWRLAEAVAVYHFSLDHDRQLEGLEAGAGEASMLRAARASSAALVREAELSAVAAQHHLAELALLPPDAPLPLPADRPHVGPYRTQFDELFSRRTAPARTRLIDRTLPIRHRAIDGRASAVQAAADALPAAVDARERGQAELASVLACMEDSLRQRRAFIASVCRYNDEIAEYALAIVSPATNGQALVGMLIHPVPHPVRPMISDNGGGVELVGQKGPLPTPARRPDQKVPTPAPPREVPGKSGRQVPTPATHWSQSGPAGKTQSRGAPPREEMGPAGKETPGVAPRREESESSKSAPPERPSEPRPAEPTRNTVNKPAIELRGDLQSPALYPGLVDATPETQAEQLTLTLHWDRTLPEGIGEAISLEDCLGSRSNGDRRALIDRYWLVRQRAAEYQALAQQAELLDSLIPVVPENEEHLTALRLRWARLTTEADLLEAHVALIEAQFELATRIGQVSDLPWPMPNTAPRSDRYVLKPAVQPRRLAESWSLRRLAEMIPSLAESVRQRATAVVEADTARAAATSWGTGNQSIEPLLASIGRQTAETFAFLQALTDYNRAIAEHALRVLPADTPDDKLVAALGIPL